MNKVKRDRLLITFCLLTGLVLDGCLSHPPAFVGNPMPAKQVAGYLEILSPPSVYDTPPKFLNGYAPFYPPRLTSTAQEGYALLEFNVTADGTTSDIHIRKVTVLEFGEEAAAAVQNWHFTPARKNGRPVGVKVRLPFTFRV